MPTPKTRRRRAPLTVDNPDAAAAALLAEAAQAAPTGAPGGPQERAETADEQDALDQLRADAGNGAYVRIRRRCLGEGEFAVLGKMDLSEFSLDRVQEIYGGGEYEVRCFAIREGKHHTIRVQRFTISHAIPPKHPLAAKPSEPAGGGTDAAAIIRELQTKVTPAGPSESTLVSLFTLMMNQQAAQQASADKRFESLLAKISENARPAGPDPLTLKLLDITLNQKQTPISELLESFSAFKKITGGKGGDDDEEDLTIWDKIGKVVAPGLEALAAGIAGSGPMPPRPGLRQPRAVTAAAEQPAATEAAPVETVVGPNGQPSGTMQPPPPKKPAPQPMNAMIQRQIALLLSEAVRAAQAGEDSKEFAGWLLDQIPAAYYDRVETIAKADDWFTQLFSATPAPEVLAQKDWLTKMRDALLEELKEEADAD